jgi:hypothetical protein
VVLAGTALWLEDNDALLASSAVQHHVLHLETSHSRAHYNTWSAVKWWGIDGRRSSVPIVARLVRSVVTCEPPQLPRLVRIRRDCWTLGNNVAGCLGVGRPATKVVDLLAPARVEPRDGRALGVATATVGQLLEVSAALDVATRPWSRKRNRAQSSGKEKCDRSNNRENEHMTQRSVRAV